MESLLFRIALVALALLLNYCNATPLPGPVSPAPPLATSFPTPVDDPFYDVPSNISTYSPGEVIRSRTVHSTEFGTTVDARQVFYRTTDRQGTATGTVATLFIPAIPAWPPKIFSYQSPEDALNIRCAPSWASVNSTSEQESYFSLLTPIATFALNQGYYIVNADDEDATSQWLVGITEGRATLDGIRATINDLGLSNDATTSALVGYSGGAHETVWACSLAASYAPELNIVGAAYGGTPVDLGAAYHLLNGGPGAALAGGAMVGLSQGYPELNRTLNQLMTSDGEALFAKLRGPDACLVESSGNFTNVNFSSPQYFKSNPIENPVAKNVLARESLLSNVSYLPIPVPKFPRFEWHGTADLTVPYAPEAEYVSQQCPKGADIIFTSYPGLDHGDAAIAGIPGALQFIIEAFDGVLIRTPCGANVSTPVVGTLEAIAVLGVEVDNLLKALL